MDEVESRRAVSVLERGWRCSRGNGEKDEKEEEEEAAVPRRMGVEKESDISQKVQWNRK